MTSYHLPSNRQASQKKDSTGIFCDIQNVPSITKFASLVLQFAKSEGTVSCKNIYYNSQRQDQVASKNKLKELGFRCVDVPDSSKNSADKRLKDDCYEAVAFNPSLKKIILFSGDRDFAVLISILKAMDKKVIVFAQRGSESPRLIKLVGNHNFHFIDQVPQLVGDKSQCQSTVMEPKIDFNEAVGYLIETVKNARSEGKPTHYSYIAKLMLKQFPKYQGVSSISTSDGSKFNKFGQLVDAAVESGRITRQNQELLLIE